MRARLAIVVLLIAAGEASAAPVRGAVFADTDGDGVRDAGEPGVATVVGWDDAVLVRTAADGTFTLDAPGPGLVWARVPAGYRPGPVWDAVGDDAADIELALIPLPAGADAAPLRFVVAADTHFASTQHLYTEAELAATIDRAIALDPPPRFFTILGDVTQATQPDELDPVARVVSALAVPWVPVAGNHDWYDGGAAWRERFGPESYSFDIGDVHLVVIDTNATDEEIAGFLGRELALVAPEATIVVLGHAPLRAEVVDEMERLGVDLFLAGHWHANRVVRHGALLELDTEPFLMGGMDALPAGYRIVTIDADGIHVEHRTVVREPWREGERCCDPPRRAPLAGEWPQPGGDARHRGAQLDAIAPPLAEVWATPVGGPVTAAPVVGGGRVLVAVSDLARGDTGGLVALDATTGAELWRVRTDVPVRAAPVLAGELAIAVQTDATVLAFDAATGKERWRHAMGAGVDPLVGTVMAAPAVDGDTVWVGHQRRFAALDLATGAERWATDPVPTAKWHTTLAAPAISGDRVVALFERNRMGLRAWTRAGVEVWQVPPTVVYGTTATPVIDGDTVYVATGVGDVAAVALEDGAVRWARVLTDDRHEWAYAIHATPAVARGVVIVATEHDLLWALDAVTGDARWSWKPGESPLYAAHYRGRGRGFTASPVITGGIVWAAPTDGTLVALDLETGAELQRLDVGAPVLAGLAAAGDLLVAASLDGTVRAFATAPPRGARGRRGVWAVVVLGVVGALALLALAMRFRRR